MNIIFLNIKNILEEKNDKVIDYFKELKFSYIFTDNIDKVSKDITNITVDNITNLDKDDSNDIKNYLQYLISEMMDNVISHSCSKDGGLVLIGYDYSNKSIKVIIIDNGIGLSKGLLNEYKVDNEKDAIKKAMEKEVTGSNSFGTYNNVQKHAGLGLYFLSRIINEIKGNLTIVSNNAIYSNKNELYGNIDSTFKGTLIAFEICIDNLDYEFTELFKIIKDEDVYEDVF